jgi:hypothetical protein
LLVNIALQLLGMLWLMLGSVNLHRVQALLRTTNGVGGLLRLARPKWRSNHGGRSKHQARGSGATAGLAEPPAAAAAAQDVDVQVCVAADEECDKDPGPHGTAPQAEARQLSSSISSRGGTPCQEGSRHSEQQQEEQQTVEQEPLAEVQVEPLMLIDIGESSQTVIS